MTTSIRARAASSAQMLAVFGDAALVAAAFRFEEALARAQAAEGLVSATEAACIAAACRAPQIDIAKLAEDAAHAGTLAIALVSHLRGLVAQSDPDAAVKVHLGATSQDLADTALVLQAKEGCALIEGDLVAIAERLAGLASAHAGTTMTGRTLLQPAQPITFGLKAANWMLAIDDALARLRRERAAALVLQFGGAAGTLAGLGGKAFAVAARMAEALALAPPALPWHARRGNLAGLGAALAIVTGAVAKIARDISLLAQGEVGEAHEPEQEGRGGSSIMAHKRNATGCQVALSAALRAPGLAATVIGAMPQEHERGLGGWQAEAPAIADLFALTHGAVAAMVPVVSGLEIDAAAMAKNLQRSGLGGDLGETAALIARALEQHRKNA